MLAMDQSDFSSAAQHFGSSVSIFDMLGDRYRAARAHAELGRAYASSQPSRAMEHLSRAVNAFRNSVQKLDQKRAESSPCQPRPYHSRKGRGAGSVASVTNTQAR